MITRLPDRQLSRVNEPAQQGGSEASTGDRAARAPRPQPGDGAAFQELYDQFAPSLYAWTRLRLQGGPAARLDPQDVVQEVWLRALGSFDSYDPTRSFRAWIIGIGKNVLLQSYRSASYDALHVHDRSPSEYQREVQNFPDSVTSISTRFAKDDAIQRFVAYVGELDPDDRMLVLFCGFEEYTCGEAATRLGLSLDATKKRWQRLRGQLRESGPCQALTLEDLA
jgi:RNA polymerase sigma factor (sigma-70 family)